MGTEADELSWVILSHKTSNPDVLQPWCELTAHPSATKGTPVYSLSPWKKGSTSPGKMHEDPMARSHTRLLHLIPSTRPYQDGHDTSNDTEYTGGHQNSPLMVACPRFKCCGEPALPNSELC